MTLEGLIVVPPAERSHSSEPCPNRRITASLHFKDLIVGAAENPMTDTTASMIMINDRAGKLAANCWRIYPQRPGRPVGYSIYHNQW